MNARGRTISPHEVGREGSWNPQCASISIVLMIFLWHGTGYTQQGKNSHPPESKGARPVFSYEAIDSFGPASEFRSAASPVGQILLELATREVVPICTALVISPKLVLTARHCLEFRDEQTGTSEPIKPRSIFLLLDYLSPLRLPTSVSLNVEPVERGSGDLDYMLLGARDTIPLGARQIPLAGADPQPQEDLYIIHHPFGRMLTLSRQYCKVKEETAEESDDQTHRDVNYFRHVCDTEESSSGAPVFDTHFALVGIHTAGGKSEQPGTFNLALLLSKVIAASPRVATALATYGGSHSMASGVKPDQSSTLSYRLENGVTFSQTAGAWELASGAVGAKTIRLRSQRADVGEFLLWDPTDDWLYLIPSSGGEVKRKHGGDLVWSEMGIATRK